MDVNQVRVRLQRAVSKAASARAWAVEHSVTPMYVSHVLSGKRLPGPAILSALGLERIVSYRAIIKPGAKEWYNQQ